MKKVSVIVTTKNEAKNIGRCLQSIQNQTYKAIEIIVVDNFSKDETKRIAKKFTKKVFDKGPERSAQRNLGGFKATGDFLMFLDADMELSENVVRGCVEEALKNKKVGGVIIPEVSVGTKFWEKTKAFERSFYNLEGDKYTDAARFFSKEAFLSVGGFDASITGPEDWDLPESVKKNGYTIKRIKEVIFHYENIPNLSSLVKKKYYYGLKSHTYLEKQNISVVSPKTIYFLRPAFYKNWRKMLSNPFLTTSMIIMLSAETLGGGLGFIRGKVRRI